MSCCVCDAWHPAARGFFRFRFFGCWQFVELKNIEHANSQTSFAAGWLACDKSNVTETAAPSRPIFAFLLFFFFFECAYPETMFYQAVDAVAPRMGVQGAEASGGGLGAEPPA